jgi:hypothetical protein
MSDILGKLKSKLGAKGPIVDEELEKIRNDREYYDAYNNIAMYKDMKKRFEDNDKDVSVGNMYQRKKKMKKTKVKRTAKKKKGCGCK